MKNIFLILIITTISSCKKEETINWKNHWENPKLKTELLNNSKIHYRIKESLKDTSIIVLTSYLKNEIENYNKLKSIGDINDDGVIDSILVIPELYIDKHGSHDNGASIIFTDKNIPRIRVNVSCVDIDFFFPVDDIDEDGLTELGQYYTSCASRFKGLRLITLKDNKWKIKEQVIFDILFESPKKEERIIKTGLNTFKMREITLENVDDKIDIWKFFEMKTN